MLVLTAMSVDSADSASARIRDCSEIEDEELKSSSVSSDSSAGIRLETLPCLSYCTFAKSMA